jgi:hypothetical protein
VRKRLAWSTTRGKCTGLLLTSSATPDTLYDNAENPLRFTFDSESTLEKRLRSPFSPELCPETDLFNYYAFLPDILPIPDELFDFSPVCLIVSYLRSQVSGSLFLSGLKMAIITKTDCVVLHGLKAVRIDDLCRSAF